MVRSSGAPMANGWCAAGLFWLFGEGAERARGEAVQAAKRMAAAAPPPEPRKVETPAPLAAPLAPAPQQAQPAERREQHVWTAEETGVTLPVALRQEVPRVPSGFASQARNSGLLEVLIDEQGRVAHMCSVYPSPEWRPYASCRRRCWKSKPATVEGGLTFGS